MARRSLISTGLIGFGVGLVVGSGFRRSSRFGAGLLERLGFELDEMVWNFWETGFQDGKADAVQSLRVKSRPFAGRGEVRRAVKRRAFSNVGKRPGVLKLANS